MRCHKHQDGRVGQAFQRRLIVDGHSRANASHKEKIRHTGRIVAGSAPEPRCHNNVCLLVSAPAAWWL
jgi:hypothetical protein